VQTEGGALSAGTRKVALPDKGPGLIHVVSAEGSAVPMRLEAWLPPTPHTLDNVVSRLLDPGEELAPWVGQLELSGVQISSLRFGRPNASPEEAAFFSSIQHGSITLPTDGTDGKTVGLGPGSPLVTSGLKGTLIHLSIERDGIHVVFNGDLETLKVGAPGFTGDLAPSMLDIAYGRAGLRQTGAIILSLLGALLPILFTWLKEGRGPRQDTHAAAREKVHAGQ
jgi:hypothetical protein